MSDGSQNRSIYLNNLKLLELIQQNKRSSDIEGKIVCNIIPPNIKSTCKEWEACNFTCMPQEKLADVVRLFTNFICHIQ